MSDLQQPPRGRGTGSNPPNRFERLHYDVSAADAVEIVPGPRTEYYRDATRSIIATNNSPDVGFDASINPYRGCEHGCAYCYARPTHAYLGLSAGLDFESKIFVKEDAPELLRQELSSRRWQPKPLAISGVTDAYQPIERRLQLTRRCLLVLAEFRNPATIITKSALVKRDIDVLAEMARFNCVTVVITVTTLDASLTQQLEPRASASAARLRAVAELNRAGIPAGVFIAPVIPGLTDHEIPEIVAAAAEHQSRFAGYTLIRLPLEVGLLFVEWLENHFPDRKEKILSRIRSMRDGKLNESRFGSRMRGEGPIAAAIRDLFQLSCKKVNLSRSFPELSIAHFRRPGDSQRTLFDDWS